MQGHFDRKSEVTFSQYDAGLAVLLPVDFNGGIVLSLKYMFAKKSSNLQIHLSWP